MHRSWRALLVLVALAVLGASWAPPAWAQVNEAAFKEAIALERSGQRKQAVQAYATAARNLQTSDRETAAEALYRAGVIASAAEPGSPPEEVKRAAVAGAGYWKQVREQYADTAADKKMLAPGPGAPVGQYAALLERADNFAEAMAEYDRVVRDNQRNNRNLAAQALYQAGLYASRYGATPAQRTENVLKAHTLWKQLADQFGDTPAAREVKEPRPNAPQGRLAAIEGAIDRENSRHWNYKVVDTLVSITGRVPAFSYAFALILIALLVKLITWPLTIKQYGSMRQMHEMQPRVKELQKKFKGVELNQKTMELYKQHGVNPFAGCLPALLQLPFLIWVYNTINQYRFAFSKGTFAWIGSPLTEQYPGIVGPNLAQPDMPLLVLYTISNYVAMRMTPAQDPQQQQQQNTMAIMSSGIFFWMFIQWKFASAFLLYWLALNLFNIAQQYHYVYKPHKVRTAAAAANGPVIDVTPDEPAKPANHGTKTAPKTMTPNTPPARVRPRRKKK